MQPAGDPELAVRRYSAYKLGRYHFDDSSDDPDWKVPDTVCLRVSMQIGGTVGLVSIWHKCDCCDAESDAIFFFHAAPPDMFFLAMRAQASGDQNDICELNM